MIPRTGKPHACLLAAFLAALVAVAGCGETEKTVAPPPVNPFAAARVGADSTLEVATWNLEAFPKYSPLQPGYVAGTPTTVDLVAQAVEAMQVDIIAVQEISTDNGGGPAFEQLVARLPGWDGRYQNTDRYINIGFLFRVDGGLQFGSAGHILNAYDDTFLRIPYAMEATWNGVPIVVIAVHLKAQESGTADEAKRRDSCLLLEEYVNAHYAGQRVFIVGDMNDELTDDPDDNVFQNFLDQPESWRFTDLAIAQGPSSGWSYPGWPSHLDHILVTDELFPALARGGSGTSVVPLHTYISGGWATYDGRISDHLPVVVRLVP